MGDADDKANLTIGPVEPRRSAGKTQAFQAVSARLKGDGVPEAKHEDKIANAALWWRRALVAGVVELAFLSASTWIVYETRNSPSIVLYVALAVVNAIPSLAVLFCANQADGEATKAFIGYVKDLVPFLRSKAS